MNTLIAIAAFQSDDGIERSLYRLSTLLPDLIIKSLAKKLEQDPHAKLKEFAVLRWLAHGMKRGNQRFYYLIMGNGSLRGMFSLDMRIEDIQDKRPFIQDCSVLASGLEDDIVLWAMFELFGLDPDTELSNRAMQSLGIPIIVPNGAHDRFLRSEAMVEANHLQELWEQKGRDRVLAWKRYAPLREQLREAGRRVVVEIGRVHPDFEDTSQERYTPGYEEEHAATAYVTDHGFYWPIEFRGRPFGFNLFNPHQWSGGGYGTPRCSDPLEFLIQTGNLMEESQYEAWYQEHVRSLNSRARTLFDIPYDSFDYLDTSVPYLWSNTDFIEYCKSLGVLTEK